jgi:hypothetical protein
MIERSVSGQQQDIFDDFHCSPDVYQEGTKFFRSFKSVFEPRQRSSQLRGWTVARGRLGLKYGAADHPDRIQISGQEAIDAFRAMPFAGARRRCPRRTEVICLFTCQTLYVDSAPQGVRETENRQIRKRTPLSPELFSTGDPASRGEGSRPDARMWDVPSSQSGPSEIVIEGIDSQWKIDRWATFISYGSDKVKLGPDGVELHGGFPHIC